MDLKSPQNIDSLYHEAYALIDQGICYDEVGHKEGAKAMYERGLALIDSAGRLPAAKDSDMYQKMRKARDYIIQRLHNLSSDTTSTTKEKDDPSSTAHMYPSVQADSTPFDSISGTLLAMGDVRGAEEIFCIPEGVQIFFIKGEETSVPSYPTSLKIFRFTEDSQGVAGTNAQTHPVAFLQVGDWVYPLIPGKSPVLHSSFGAWMFPDLKSEAQDSNVGVILPSDLDESLVSEFESLLNELTEVRQEIVPIARTLSKDENQQLNNKLAQMLIKGSELACWGIEKGTKYADGLIRRQSTQVLKDAQPGKHIHVDPRVQTSVHYLRKGTKVAVKCSSYVVNRLGDACMYMGKKLAKGANSAVGGKGTQEGTFLYNVVEVGKAGVTGAANVWMNLESSANVLAKSLANETVTVVKYKYGEDMGNVTDNAIYTAYQTGATAWNISEIGPKAIAKRTAKKTGLALLEDLGSNRSEKQLKLQDGSSNGP